jgi:hypothetical protein
MLLAVRCGMSRRARTAAWTAARGRTAAWTSAELTSAGRRGARGTHMRHRNNRQRRMRQAPPSHAFSEIVRCSFLTLRSSFQIRSRVSALAVVCGEWHLYLKLTDWTTTCGAGTCKHNTKTVGATAAPCWLSRSGSLLVELSGSLRPCSAISCWRSEPAPGRSSARTWENRNRAKSRQAEQAPLRP